MAITDQVQSKLDQNIKEGFAQFEKVQQHLSAAEEQLREVGALGHSINDLNNLLKLPHLRGLWRGESRTVTGRFSTRQHVRDAIPLMVAAVRRCHDQVSRSPLPIDAKFPREQVLALFEDRSEAQLEEARLNLCA